MMLIYDIMPPRKRETKTRRTYKRRKPVVDNHIHDAWKKIISLVLIIGLNLTGLSLITGTSGLYNDVENSSSNTFTAGTLDFELLASEDFSPLTFSNNYFVYDSKPNTVYVDGSGTDVSSQLCTENPISVDTSNGDTHYIYMNWNLGENLSVYENTDYFNLKIQHKEDTTVIKVELKNKTGDWVEVCDPSESGSYAWDTCDLTPFINTLKDVSPNVEMRMVAKRTGNCHEYLKCAKLEAKMHSLTTSQTRNITFVNHGNDPKYTVSATGFSSDLCNYVNLKADLDGTTIYTGPIKNFITDIIFFSDPDEWSFTASLAPDTPLSVQGQTCNFKFVYSGSQIRNDLPLGQGFSDVEEIVNNITVGGIGGEEPMLVINKVYYDVDSAHGVEGDNEWIELYNPGNEAIDLNGWIIKDNTSQDTIASNSPIMIPALGFAIITPASSTWNYWDIPAGVVKIQLNSDIGNGLADDGDRVILKTPDGIAVDAMSYGDDTYALNPSCPDVAEGHMLGRVPSGTDTDTNNDWKDLALPSLTITYPVGGEVWYVGHTYNILWSASNPNGPDSDLKVDLYYSGTSGATWGNIVKGTENDGSFTWYVPLFIEPGHYYVPSEHSQIKVVANGPENFMVQARVSSRDFCPPIDYDALSPEDQQMVDQLLKDGTIDESTVIRGGVRSEELAPTSSITEEIVNAVGDFIGNIIEQPQTEEPQPESVEQPQIEPENTNPETVNPPAEEPTTEENTPIEPEKQQEVISIDEPMKLPESILSEIQNVVIDNSSPDTSDPGTEPAATPAESSVESGGNVSE